ncbi:hypothetical protein FQR65_LT15273 [Abscondita terminalis]|nr:hypothetical protein FQR65_LT15273 [Abscondita terminalis]
MWPSFVIILCCATTLKALCESPCQCKLVNKKSTALCANGNFRSVPKSLDPDNEDLDLSHNLITRLGANVFRDADLLNLQSLNLHGNQIDQIDEDAFRGVVNLRLLDLSDNKIVALKPDTIPRWVIRLNLNSNPLKRLEPMFLTSPLLRYLALENCQLEDVHPQAFQLLSGLQDLSLRDNKFTHLNESVFKDLSSLRFLHLEGNPWNCNCNFRKFKDWYYKMDAGTVTCANPKELKGKVWKNLISSNENFQFITIEVSVRKNKTRSVRVLFTINNDDIDAAQQRLLLAINNLRWEKKKKRSCDYARIGGRAREVGSAFVRTQFLTCFGFSVTILTPV